MRRVLLAILGTVVVTGSAAVIAAQHVGPASASGAASPFAQTVMHAGCQGGDQEHVPGHLATMLELTPDQTATLNRMGADACETMRKVHEQMLTVLTPEQRAKVAKLHGDGGRAGLHATMHEWFKKLHGR